MYQLTNLTSVTSYRACSILHCLMMSSAFQKSGWFIELLIIENTYFRSIFLLSRWYRVQERSLHTALQCKILKEIYDVKLDSFVLKTCTDNTINWVVTNTKLLIDSNKSGNIFSSIIRKASYYKPILKAKHCSIFQLTTAVY